MRFGQRNTSGSFAIALRKRAVTEQPYILRVCFTQDLEHTKGYVSRIISAIKRPMETGMHTKREIGFVIRTMETETELMDRLRPTLDEIQFVDNWWCHRAPPIIVAKYGSMDTLSTRVSQAWAQVRERRHSKYVRQTEPGQRGV